MEEAGKQIFVVNTSKRDRKNVSPKNMALFGNYLGSEGAEEKS